LTDTDKKALRAELQELREEAHARDPDAGEALAAKFPMKLLERYGPIVSGYLPIGSEIDPLPLLQRLATQGARIALPRIDEDGDMSFRLWNPADPLEDGSFGLRQPTADAPLTQPTLVLLPLLAFDKLGNRLGYGQGHFDKALQALRTEGRVFACGLAFHAQMLEDLPVEPHDQPLDWAMTERGSVPIFMMRAFASDDGDGEGPTAA